MRFLKELAGPQLPPFLQEIASRGDDFGRLAALELARELPAQTAFDIARRVLTASNPTVRARALKAVSEMTFEGSADVAANLAVPLLQDENEEIRYSALAVLEKNPNESYFPDVLQMARTGGGRVMEASFAALKKLLAGAKQDHTPEIVPLLADGNALGEERDGRPPAPLRARPPRPPDPRALPRLVRLGARPGRRDGAGRAAGLRERAPEAHARRRSRARQGGLRDDARARGRQGPPDLDPARRRQGLLGQDARDRDARPPRQGRRRRPDARPRGPEGARARDPGRVRARRPRRPARRAASPRRVQGRRDAAGHPDGDPRLDGEARVRREDRDADRRHLLAGFPDARAGRARAREGAPPRRRPQGDRGARRAARGRGRGPDRRARRQRLGAPRRVPRGHGQARRLGPPPRHGLRPAPAHAGPPRGRRRADHDAGPRLPAHPRGAAGGRLEEARARAPDRHLSQAARASGASGRTSSRSAAASTPVSASSRRRFRRSRRSASRRRPSRTS